MFNEMNFWCTLSIKTDHCKSESGKENDIEIYVHQILRDFYLFMSILYHIC